MFLLVQNLTELIEYEILRQEKEVSEGKTIKQQTRAFNEKHGTTVFMRLKETAADYMFIPEPDLPVIKLAEKDIKKIKDKLPERPDEKIKRFIAKHKIKKEDAFVICSDILLSELFEKTAKKINPLFAARWLRFELLRVLNYNKKELSETKINEKHIIDLLRLIEAKKITETTAQKILESLAKWICKKT